MTNSEENSKAKSENNSVQYYPLTYPQKAMWYTEKVHPGTSIGNVSYTIKFKGEIDYRLLEKSLNIFIENNDAMRLRVIEENGEPKQYVSEHIYHRFELFDFSGKNIEELYKWEEQQSQIPFELIDSDLFYCVLIKIDDNTGGIYGRNHHLIADACTMTIMSDQVVENYIKLKNGEEISIDKKPSYLEYILSEKEYTKSERYQKDKEYWNNKFNILSEQTPLKVQSSTIINANARRKTLLVPKKLTTKMQQYCKENKISIFALFMSALSMYINRITGNEHVILGTTTLNRANKKEKEIIGMFSNISCVQIELNDNMDFRALTANVSKETISLLRHQKYPYYLIIKEVRRKHKITCDLFDIVLNYQNSKYSKSEHSEEYVTRWHFNGHQSNNLIININDRESDGHLIIDYDYLINLFHAKEVEFIHQHIINLLWHALDDPSKNISKLNMLSEKEKHKILYEFDNNKIVYPEGILINSLSQEITAGKSYILDKNLNLMPIGIAGELYISASDNNVMTTKEIIGNPYEPGKKLYKTGHMARWFPEGDIEYKHRKEKKKQAKETQVKIVSTFTSEPIHDYIEWWGKNFGHNLKTEFAGYNQVFQELLNPDSMLSKNKEGINIVLVRFEDFIRNDIGTEQQKIATLEQVFEELTEAINKFDNPAPLITAIFPVSTHLNLHHGILTKINDLNHRFKGMLLEHKNIYVVELSDVQEMYSIQEVFDSIKDKEGHMPFTEEYYAAFGTELARKICAVMRQHFKVIVVDCDNTIWEGICGEQGALGVKVQGGYKILQEFLFEKNREGFLLAVCSKNNEKDVIEVFETNQEMILRKNNIASWKVNWEEKSQNIKDIANELNLGLDSFIFIDDNPIECSKMVENHPEVLTLQLPTEEEFIPMFLKHVWAFDKVKVTKEDSLRTTMYQAEKKRKEIKNTGLSLEDFIRNLGIKVSMRLIHDVEIPRVSQMTQRTNQFNLSTIRRSEEEISKLIKDKKTKCFAIEASDRLGDYGIIGLVILKDQGSKLFIDTFLLSCRILGRRVEDAVFSGIRRFAEELGIKQIVANYIPTEKNKPILDFIERLQWSIVKKYEKHAEYKGEVSCLPQQIEHIEFYYNQAYEKSCEIVEALEPEKIIASDHILISEKDMNGAENSLPTFAEYNLCDTKILGKVKLKEYILPLTYFTSRRLLKLPIFEGINYSKSNYAAPENEIEKTLAQIWEQILRTKKVGIDDDFFELGGDSLKAIQLQVSLLKYNWNLTTQDIYKYRTIRQLSNVIISMDKNGTENVAEVNDGKSVAVKDINTKIISINKEDMHYSNLLLIGATGYLGSHILNELLTSTRSNIYCLVRAKTNNNARERLKDTLKFYFGNTHASVIDKRVFTVNGDITLEYLGLEQDEYIQLQNKIDATIHAGALVSYYGDYSNFEEINIRGTEKVVKFCQENNKPLLYTSTMGISGQYLVATKDKNKLKVFTENDLYIGQNYFDNPYVRSKYEAEILLNKYIKAGAKIAVLRVGNLTGRFTDGHFQKNITQNAFYNIIKSIISIGAVSKNILNEAFDFTPVDYCSKAIVRILMKEESLGRVFHLYNHNINNVSQIIELFRDLGIEIKCLDQDEFKELIKKVISDESSRIKLKGIINDFDEESQLKFKTSVKLNSEITLSYLKQLGFEWPPINAEYMQKIINYMKEVNYI
ncbi:MAG: thioester reductase domain-containing protein [Ignavibacteriales bacterium]